MTPETYKPDPKILKLEYWNVKCGDIGTKLLTNNQFETLLEAEKQGVRLVRFEDFVINPAFVRGATRVVQEKTELDLMHFPLDEKEKKFIVEDKRPKQLK